MRVSTNPTPNIRLVDLTEQQPAGPFCLWELERQAAGLEPGELATKASIDFHPSATDPILDVLLVLLFACIGFELVTSIRFLCEAMR